MGTSDEEVCVPAEHVLFNKIIVRTKMVVREETAKSKRCIEADFVF